ncbi:UTP--glucose-1-phosphate uridylyltransferase GalU [Arthrobacter deserti]|uniref:UTP--glucose-1-phosphate uridylyltransferase n=1 Tax=Arthrobacter deserti TaxID=1742687 RepID=A0ABX1JN06_9MICC|nr:UTP--glucose-1-phosphate uridylyltransferase GalU [Arthrobacter deserti]
MVRKAVIPAAGLGTRFLPATKAMPKEMLPVVDKPAIQYVVEEAVRSGISDVLMITGRNKRPLEDHFDRVPFLESTLEQKGDHGKLSAVRETSSMADIHYLRQGDPKGLGHAVLRARYHVGDEPFAVLLGDDLIDGRDSLLEEMIAVQAATGGSVVALMEVEPEQISAYGCADITPAGTPGCFRINSLVEKPAAGGAPSNLAVIGRYVLHPRVFDVLETTAPGRGGEIQLTDALQTLAASEGEGSGVYGVVFRGRRYDTGDKFSYIKAVVTLAGETGEFAPQLRRWLQEQYGAVETDPSLAGAAV